MSVDCNRFNCIRWLYAVLWSPHSLNLSKSVKKEKYRVSRFRVSVVHIIYSSIVLPMN